MPQSLAKLTTHIIFSTKRRRPMIPADLTADLNAYFVGVLRKIDCPSIQVNSLADHVHILCCLSRTLSLAQLIEEEFRAFLERHEIEYDERYVWD